MPPRIHILPLPEPYALRRAEAAAYVGLSAGHFDKAVNLGLLPQPLDLVGVKVWPRRALEHALTQSAGAMAKSFEGVQ